MRIRTALAVVAALAAVGVLAPPSTAAAWAKCTAPKGAVVLKTKDSVVYFRDQASKRYPNLGVQRIYYGCVFSVGKARRLNGWTDFDQHLGNWALAGRYVAFSYDVEEGAGDLGTPSIPTYDLRTGKLLKRQHSPVLPDKPGWDVHAIALKRNSSIAWISSYTEGDDAHNVYQVHKLERDLGQQQTKVDEGTTIDPESLALGADRRSVFWTKDGATQSSSLR